MTNTPIRNSAQTQSPFPCSILPLPSHLAGFNCIKAGTFYSIDNEIGEVMPHIYYEGVLDKILEERACPICGCKMHVKSQAKITLRHIPLGGHATTIAYYRKQYKCECCLKTKTQNAQFKHLIHRMTYELYDYICHALATGEFTVKTIARMTGVGKTTIKKIDAERLALLYTTDGKKFIKPEEQATFLAIDEFLLHHDHCYATHIIDLQRGRVLLVARGKKKQVVYDFINHVGLEWMSKVVAVACDMNSDFQKAFQEKCPHITIVFDHFHLIKNFNAVIDNIRKDEQKRLVLEGRPEEAKRLKGSKYILIANRWTLQEQDKEALEKWKAESRGKPESERRQEPKSRESRYDEIIRENWLLFICDLIKEAFKRAYEIKAKKEMEDEIKWIINICDETENTHLVKFANLLRNHFDGIVAHADFLISSGKIEGINNKIKTLRRRAYGYPDDDYFFLKLFDITRKKKRNRIKPEMLPEPEVFYDVSNAA